MCNVSYVRDTYYILHSEYILKILTTYRTVQILEIHSSKLKYVCCPTTPCGYRFCDEWFHYSHKSGRIYPIGKIKMQHEKSYLERFSHELPLATIDSSVSSSCFLWLGTMTSWSERQILVQVFAPSKNVSTPSNKETITKRSIFNGLLPLKPLGTKPRVGIVGAGISGLVAGYLLNTTGYSVEILKTKERDLEERNLKGIPVYILRNEMALLSVEGWVYQEINYTIKCNWENTYILFLLERKNTRRANIQTNKQRILVCGKVIYYTFHTTYTFTHYILHIHVWYFPFWKNMNSKFDSEND